MSDKVAKPPQTISFKNYFFSALVVGRIFFFLFSFSLPQKALNML